MPSPTTVSIEELDRLSLEFSTSNKRPLLILYYHEYEGEMIEDDIDLICEEIRRRGHNRENKIKYLNILIHTMGGNPHVGYRIAQLIRDMASNVTFLVPNYAFSAGTLSCMCGNDIKLGDCAVLSPIDVSIIFRGTSEENIELMSIDYFSKFAADCREQVERMLKEIKSENPSRVDSDLLVKMTDQVGALNIGKFYRARTLTGHYAKMLLTEYMFEDRPNKKDLANKIVQAFLFRYPTHDFHMDFHICKELGLPVNEMTVEDSDKTKKIVSVLKQLTIQETICRTIRTGYKAPFTRLYVGGDGDESTSNK